MSLFLNGVETNTVMLNGVETTGFFNGNMVWGYQPKYYNFTLNNTNNNVAYYAKYTQPNGTTGELSVPTGANGGTASVSIIEGSTITGYVLANTYYRTTLNSNILSELTTAKTTSDPRRKTFTATLTGDTWIGTQNTQQNNVVWTWTFNNQNYPKWTANSGGCYRVNAVPNTGRMTINSCYPDGSAYCCRLIIDSYSGQWLGSTARPKPQPVATANIPAARLGALDSNVWKNVYQSAHINLTAGYYHSNQTWTGTASNGGQRGLKANYLYNSNQNGDPGKNINNGFYQGTKNSTKTTSFNVVGTGNNMAATNWNNQIFSVYATLGMITGGMDTDASKRPPNQINNVNATVKCSAWLP